MAIIDSKNVKKYLQKFMDGVVLKSRKRAQKASTRMASSIRGELDIFPNSFSLSFYMLDYGEFQDRGVSGTDPDAKYNTPFSYKEKMPPPSAFDRWSIRRGIAPRDSSGRFLSRKSINFALAKHIFKRGIKPKRFFSGTLDEEFRKMPPELIKAYGLDIERGLEVWLQTESK